MHITPLIVVIVLAIAGLIPARIAWSRGRNFYAWWAFGFVVFPLALVLAIFLDPVTDDLPPESRPEAAPDRVVAPPVLGGLAEQSWLVIVAKHDGTCLEIGGGKQENGAPANQWDYAGLVNQQWLLVRTKDGFYSIRARHSGKCLEIGGGRLENGARADQWDYLGLAHQKWQLIPTKDEHYFIRAKHSAKCLQVASGSRENGAAVNQGDYAGLDYQQWQLRRA